MSTLRPSENSNGAKPRALLVAPEAPYPVVGGGPLRTASLLEYLAQRYTVDVIVFHEPGSPHPAGLFPADLVGTVDVVELPFHSERPVARMIRNASRFAHGTPPLVDRFSGFTSAMSTILQGRRYALGIIEHFWCAEYVTVLKQHCARVALDLHNVESVLLDRCRRSEGLLLAAAFKRFAAACGRMERELLPQFTDLLVCSEDDARLVTECSPASKVTVYPNAIPYRHIPVRNKSNSIVFSGNMRYRPNLYAVTWFHKSIWPEIQNECPKVTWELIGKNPEYLPLSVRQDPSVQIIGPVEDAIEALAGARVAVAPLLVGSGTRFKIIEAWAAGVPVVSTTVGAEGLPGTGGDNLLIADTPREFAQSVCRLLASEDLCNRLAGNARQLFESSLNWSAAWRELQAAGF